MAFSVKTTLDFVLQESPAQGLNPMLLPWSRLVEDAGGTARMGGGVIPAGAQNVKVDFPGITTLSTLFVFPDADVEIVYGPANAQPIPVLAGGCTGFSRGNYPADQGLRFTYAGTQDASFVMVWAGS